MTDAAVLAAAREQVRAAIAEFCAQHEDQDIGMMLQIAESTMRVTSTDDLRHVMADAARFRDDL